jgi:hypothetical protein
MSKAGIGAIITAALMSTAGRLLTAIGFGVITYTGLDIIQRKFIQQALQSWNSLPSDAIQILLLGGVGIAMNWVFGAIAFIVTFKSVGKFGHIMKGK